jgi:hypothetical protein
MATNSLGAGLMGIRVATRPPVLFVLMEYSVEVPPALLETHQGLPFGLATSPQAFSRFLSCRGPGRQHRKPDSSVCNVALLLQQEEERAQQREV